MIKIQYKQKDSTRYSGTILFSDFFTSGRPDQGGRGSFIAQRIEADIAFDNKCAKNIELRQDRLKQKSDANV